jgi:hypothetical protein
LVRTGGYKLARLEPQILSDSLWYSAPSVFWVINGSAGLPVLANSSIMSVTGVNASDILDITSAGTAQFPVAGGGTTLAALGLAASQYAPGVSPPTATHISGSGTFTAIAQSGSFADVSFSLHGFVLVTQTGNVDLYYQGVSSIFATPINIFKESTTIVRVWRPTGVLQ